MDRRRFLAALSGALPATPGTSTAQQAGPVPRVGLLFPLSRPVASVSADALESGFRELGYVLGKSLILEYRWAEGHADRLPGLAAELVDSKVDLIVSVATQATLAAKAATPTIPIVTVGAADPVGTGLVQSLARPGGNVTGIGVHQEEFVAKLPELLKEALPRVSRIGYLEDPSNPAYAGLLAVVRDRPDPDQRVVAVLGQMESSVPSRLLEIDIHAGVGLMRSDDEAELRRNQPPGPLAFVVHALQAHADIGRPEPAGAADLHVGVRLDRVDQVELVVEVVLPAEAAHAGEHARP